MPTSAGRVGRKSEACGSWGALLVMVIAPKVDADDPLESSQRDEVVLLRAQRVALDAQEALAPSGEREDVDLAELEGAAQQREVLLEAREDLGAIRARAGCRRDDLAARFGDLAVEQASRRIQFGFRDRHIRPGACALPLIQLEARDGDRDDAHHDVVRALARRIAFASVLHADGWPRPRFAIGERQAGLGLSDPRSTGAEPREALA